MQMVCGKARLSLHLAEGTLLGDTGLEFVFPLYSLLKKKENLKNEKVQFFPPATLGFSCLANLNSNRPKEKTVFFWPFLSLDFQRYFPLCRFIYEKKPFKKHSLFTRTKQLL